MVASVPSQRNLHWQHAAVVLLLAIIIGTSSLTYTTFISHQSKKTIATTSLEYETWHTSMGGETFQLQRIWSANDASGHRVLQSSTGYRLLVTGDVSNVTSTVFQSGINMRHSNHPSTMPYTVGLHVGLVQCQRPIQRVLVLGLGAGIFPRSLQQAKLQHLQYIDAVDLDSSMYDIAVEYFFMNGNDTDHRLRFHSQDAVQFVAEHRSAAKDTYDVIMSDLFPSTLERSLSELLPEIYTTEFIINLYDSLMPGGTLTIHIHSYPDFFPSIVGQMNQVCGGNAGTVKLFNNIDEILRQNTYEHLFGIQPQPRPSITQKREAFKHMLKDYSSLFNRVDTDKLPTIPLHSIYVVCRKNDGVSHVNAVIDDDVQEQVYQSLPSTTVKTRLRQFQHVRGLRYLVANNEIPRDNLFPLKSVQEPFLQDQVPQ